MATHREIAKRAYEIWQSKGGGHGHDEADWVEAEHELGVTVLLSDVGENKIGVIRELRTVTGFSLEEARRIAERAPVEVKQLSSSVEAEAIRQRLIALGAKVELR